jgi:voltage-gated sodium channel
VQHWLFELIASILILLSFINALFFIYNYSDLVDTFDSIFVWIFVGELLLRVVGIGPENFFTDRWNNLDAFLVATSVLFFFLNNNAGSIAKMGRIFRLARLLRIVSHTNFMENVQMRSFDKLSKIFSVIL